MSRLDLEQLLTPIAGDQPCGRDLFEDPRFYAIQQAMQGQPAREMGDSMIAAVPPDYRAAANGCLALLGESKDLRLAVTLTDALLAEEGHPGFAAGLELVRGLIERFWDHVHPALEEGDPLNRVVTVESLDDRRLAYRVRKAPLLRSTSFTQRHYSLALGHEQPTEAELEEGGLPTLGDFQQAIAASGVDDLREAVVSIRSSLACIEGIGRLMEEKGGAPARVKLEELPPRLRQCLKPLEEALESRGDDGGEGATNAGGASAGGASGVPAAAAPGQALPSSIQTRQQARQAIELAVRYFEAHEPSHPAPILLRRAQGLLDKPFLDVIEGLFPNDSDLLSSIRRLLQLPSEES